MEQLESDNLNLDQSQSYTARPNLKFNFLKSLDLDKDTERKLSLNLERIVLGSDEIYLTPIGKNNDPQSLLHSLDIIMSDGSSLIENSLYDLEQNNRAKFGPRSIALPWKSRKKSLLSYYDNDKTNIFPLGLGDPLVASNPKLRPLSLVNGVDYLKNSTNSGLPYYTRKSLVKERVVKNFDSLLKSEYPCVLFTRTQEQEKTRNVWGYPMADTLNEMLYYFPLLNYQKRFGWRSCLLGPDYVDLNVTNLMSKSHLDGKSILSVDFSGYDATISSSLQLSCFNYIKELFQPEFASSINVVSRRFNEIGIITPDGIMSGKHGVPSGATFTNEVDSLAQYKIAKSSGIDMSLCQIQGDDGLYSMSDDELSKFKSTCQHYGLELNDEKSYFNKEFCIFLQKYYSLRYIKSGLVGGIYPLYRALNRIIYQERYSNFEEHDLSGQDYYSIRTISILENCKYHPLFNKFVEFILSKDKYLLKFSRSSITKYNNMVSGGKAGVGVIANQYGDNVNGIDNFATVKLIRSLS